MFSISGYHKSGRAKTRRLFGCLAAVASGQSKVGGGVHWRAAINMGVMLYSPWLRVADDDQVFARPFASREGLVALASHDSKLPKIC